LTESLTITDRRDGGFWVEIQEDKVVGTFRLERASPAPMELRRMYVDPGARRLGVTPSPAGAGNGMILSLLTGAKMDAKISSLGEPTFLVNVSGQALRRGRWIGPFFEGSL